jgi:Fe-S cluster biosynthesis and repair protein YggX
MARTIHCLKYGDNQVALSAPPYPGDKGQYIFDHVGAKAWQEWLGHQTMLLNEHRLNPLDPATKTFLEQEMDKFFQNDSEKPAGFIPEDTST